MKANVNALLGEKVVCVVVAMCLLVLGVVALSPNASADMGVEVWSRVHNGGNGDDCVGGVALDSQGNVIVVGVVKGLNSPEHHTNAYATKYDPNGGVLWTVELDMGEVGGSKSDSNDSFSCVAVDSEDNVIVGGTVSGVWTGLYPSSYHRALLVQKYAPDGTLLWGQVWKDVDSSEWQGANGIVVDGDDSIYITGSALHDWDRTTEGEWITLKYDKNGNLVLGPLYYNFGDRHYIPDEAYDVVVDLSGNIIVVGQIGVSGADGGATNDLDWHVIKYDPTGIVLWEDTYSGIASLCDVALGVDVDGNGDVFVVGYTNKGTDNDENADCDWLMIKYSAAGAAGQGERVWIRTFESAPGRSELCRDVHVDGAGNILVSGCEYDEFGISRWRLERRDGGSGALLADQVFETGMNGSINAIDARNGMIALGGWEDNGSDTDMRAVLVDYTLVADDQSVGTEEDTPVLITLTASDPSEDLSFSVVDQPAHGVFIEVEMPNLTYLPNLDYNGSDSFTFKAYNGVEYSNVATVNITVYEVNDAPVAHDQAVATSEGTPVNIALSGLDVDGDPLTFRVDVGPTHGVLTGDAPKLTYSPELGYKGADSFTFISNDGVLDSSPATVIVKVNYQPEADTQAVLTDEDTPIDIVLTGSDDDGDSLTFHVINQPIYGVLSGDAPNLTYVPDSDYCYDPEIEGSSVDGFSFVVNDGIANSPPATVTIIVGPVNDAPVGNEQELGTEVNTSIDIVLSGSDVDGDALTYWVIEPPGHGTLSGDTPSLTYIPEVDYYGPDSFTFRAKDETATYSNIATVSIIVNAPPVADDHVVTTNEDTSVDIVLSGSDAEGGPLTFIVVSDPEHGKLVGTVPNMTYVPDSDYGGPDSFTYMAEDGRVYSNVATVTITVNALNDAPRVVNDTYSVDEDSILSSHRPGVLANDMDIEDDPFTAILVSDVGNGTLILNADGSFSYTPNADFNGEDSFSYKATDGMADSYLATVTIAVYAIDDPPVAVDDSYTVDEDAALEVPAPGVLGNDSNVDNDPLSAILIRDVRNGTLVLNADGSFIYTPEKGFDGTDSFVYKVDDGITESNLSAVTITVEVAEPAGSGGSGIPGWIWIVIALAVILLGAGVFVIVRRRTTASGTEQVA